MMSMPPGTKHPPRSPACDSRIAVECFPRASMEAKAKYGCGMIANPAPIRTDEEVEKQFLANGCLKHEAMCNGCCNPAGAPGEPQGDGSCCYAFCAGSCCGRPLIIDGVIQRAGVEPRRDWLRAFAPAETHARIATEWLEDARMEHASIASFARFTLDLLAFGAPAALVEGAQRAALEEVEHARLCFGLAARFGAGECGPSPLSAAGIAAAASLWDATLAAFDEGCVGETLAALQARAAFERAKDPEVRRALELIAEQEGEHAALAWRFVTWAAGRLGDALARELERRVQRLAAVAEAGEETEVAAVVAELHAAGRLTAGDKQRIAVAAVREVVTPCLGALLGARNDAVRAASEA